MFLNDEDPIRDERDGMVWPLSGQRIVQIALYADESVEDLQRQGLRLIQQRNGFRFGEDSVFLAAAASRMSVSHQPAGERVWQMAELGSGCGAVTILLAGRLPRSRFVALELCSRPFDALQRNIRLNKLTDRITAVQGDICRLADGTMTDPALPWGQFDRVISNPPYRVASHHLANQRANVQPGAWDKRLAVEEIALTLDELVHAAARLLRPQGLFWLVHRPARLPDLLTALRHWRIEPRTLQAIQPRPDAAPSSILLTGQAQGRPGSFRWLPPLTVRSANGGYTPEVLSLYGSAQPLSAEDLLTGLVPVDRLPGPVELWGPDPIAWPDSDHHPNPGVLCRISSPMSGNKPRNV